MFSVEPPHRAAFSNSSGLRLDCMATGSPPPRITWQIVTGNPEGVPALPIAGLRHTHPNGSLEMLPFPMELYRSDVHAVKYRCRASNQVGAIVSKDVHVHGGKRGAEPFPPNPRGRGTPPPTPPPTTPPPRT